MLCSFTSTSTSTSMSFNNNNNNNNIVIWRETSKRAVHDIRHTFVRFAGCGPIYCIRIKYVINRHRTDRRLFSIFPIKVYLQESRNIHEASKGGSVRYTWYWPLPIHLHILHISYIIWNNQNEAMSQMKILSLVVCALYTIHIWRADCT